MYNVEKTVKLNITEKKEIEIEKNIGYVVPS
jgi:hypothetical protein